MLRGPGTKTDAQMSRRKIDDLLEESHRGFSPLQKLLRQAGNQSTWTDQLRAVLPETIAKECRVTDIQGPVVVVICRSAGAATRLRFMAPELVDRLRQLADFRNAQSLKIKVVAT